MTPIVARVAGRPIPLALVERRIEELRRGPRGRQLPAADGPGYADLCRWIARELVTEAIVADEARRRRVPVDDVITAVTGGVTVSEEESRAYYERNQDLFRRPERRTIDWQGVGRVDLRHGELVGPFEDEVFAGAVEELVRGGGHEARIVAIHPPGVVPFEQARVAIEGELLVAARERAFDAWLEERRREIVAVEPEWEHPGHPVHGLPSHRH